MKTYIFVISYNAKFNWYVFRCEQLKYEYVFDCSEYDLLDAMTETKQAFKNKLHINIIFDTI